VLRAHGYWFSETKLEKLHGVLPPRFVINFVREHKDGLASPSQEIGDFLVGRDNTVSSINDEQKQSRLCHRLLDLAPDQLGVPFFSTRIDAACVDKSKSRLAPTHFAVAAIAGRTSYLLNQGLTFANEAVKER